MISIITISQSELSFFELTISCLIIMIPFALGVIIQRRYNIFHGIISYFFFNYILCFIFVQLSTTISFLSTTQCLLIVSATITPYNFIYESILLIPNIKENIVSNEEYIVLTIVFLIYLLLHMTFLAIDRIKY